MIAIRLIIEGVVQGVGFRPFIHRLAVKHGVKGYVRNVGGSEVEVFVEGSEESVASFIKSIYVEHPPPACIESIELIHERPRGFKEFKILRSSVKVMRRSAIPPDLAMCDECLREVLNPNDRRFRYPFNSCAWCGPRYSMMYSIPYDRDRTAMRDFPLCDECLREYRDLSNERRYHAQGISCPKCGPKLWLEDGEGERVECKDPIREAAKLIDEGYILAVKGLGGYHIAALASNDDVVAELRRRKGRPSKPFAVMGLDTDVLSELVIIDDRAKEILNSPQSPILLLPKREGSPVSSLVSPGMAFEGVFRAYTPLHYLLLMETRDRFLIMTSGNRVGLPMCVSVESARKQLKGIVDYMLHHNREIVNRVDDSVLRFTCGKALMIRRARGYAPLWVRLNVKLPNDVIAFGADIQGVGAVGFEDKVILTQYVGDLENTEVAGDLLKFLNYLTVNYSVKPEKAVVAIDKHPNYVSSKLGKDYALKHGSRVTAIQHHYAHALSVMADHGIIGRRVAAVTIDGVGYGDDGAVWGGEVIIVNEDLSYRRIAHLEYLPLVGGDLSVKYPARYLATALAVNMGWDEAVKALRVSGAIRGLSRGSIELMGLQASLSKGLYVPSSSTGRFLDAVSALLNVCLRRTYEGEPAVLLESLAFNSDPSPRIMNSFKVIRLGDELIIKVSDAIRSTYESVYVKREVKPSSAARSVQEGLGRALGQAVKEVVREWGVKEVVVGGGAAVNEFIVRGLMEVLRELNVRTLLPRKVPPGDGGVALGQVVAASLLNTS